MCSFSICTNFSCKTTCTTLLRSSVTVHVSLVTVRFCLPVPASYCQLYAGILSLVSMVFFPSFSHALVSVHVVITWCFPLCKHESANTKVHENVTGNRTPQIPAFEFEPFSAQVIYSEDSPHKLLPQLRRTAVFLGPWHVYKMATTVVWRLAASAVFAPFFHQLFPEAAFPWSPRLLVSSRILTLLRLAFPHVRDMLEKKISGLSADNNFRVIRTHALNLYFLLSWLIPKVSVHVTKFNTSAILHSLNLVPAVTKFSARVVFVRSMTSVAQFEPLTPRGFSTSTSTCS